MRRLPTSVFTLVATLVITLGAGWWVSAEPPAPQPPAGSSRVVLDLGHGKLRTFVIQKNIQSACRPARRSTYADAPRTGNGAAPSNRSRFGRAPRCGGR
jgi:hypothetical protein